MNNNALPAKRLFLYGRKQSIPVNMQPITREEARRLNQVIDWSLLEPSASRLDAVMRLSSKWDASRVAERVRRRATRLGRMERERRQGIIRSRDRMILALYGQAVPAGWYVGWSDGSVSGDGRRAGIGGLVLAARGRMPIAEISAPLVSADPFTAELAALAAVLRLALELGAERLRLYTDCDAACALWLHNRTDPRLVELRDLVHRLRRFDLRSIPRQHNQPAHRLARRALEQFYPDQP